MIRKLKYHYQEQRKKIVGETITLPEDVESATSI